MLVNRNRLHLDDFLENKGAGELPGSGTEWLPAFRAVDAV
jgi:hypothetical protein